MAEVGSAWVSVLPSAKGFGSKLESEVGGEVSGSGKSIGSKFGSAFKVGALAVLAGVALTGKFLKGAVEEAREAQIVTARTENVIKSMGLAGKVSATQIADLAGAISAKTGIDDEAIQSGQNLLLTFKNVASSAGQAGGVFERTSGLMVDLSAAMGTDAKGAAIQLGKALNDPVKGISALTRVGVSFSEQQKAQIEGFVETGQLAKAQGIILGELQNQFGGAAEAMATPADKARVAYDNLKEQIGTALLPVLDRLISAFTTQIAPAIANFVTQVQTGVGAGGALRDVFTNIAETVGPILASIVAGVTTFVQQMIAGQGAGGTFATIMGQVGAALGVVGTFLVNNGATVAAFVGVIYAASVAAKAFSAAMLIVNVVLSANPIGIVIVAVAALVAGLVYAYKNSDTFRQKVDFLWAAFKRGVAAAQPLIARVVEFGQKIAAVVLPIVVKFASFLGGAYVSYVKAAINVIGNIISALINFGKALVDGAQEVARFAKAAKEKFDDVVAFAKAIPARVKSAIGDLSNLLFSAGASLVGGLIDGIKSRIAEVSSTVAGIADNVKGFFGGSPVEHGPLLPWNKGAPGKNIMGLLAKGITAGAPGVSAATEAVALEISDHFEKLREQLETKRDAIKGVLDGLRSDFASLRDGIASTFTGNLFEAEGIGGFLTNLVGTSNNLKALKAAFKKLVGYGLQPAFLSQLFASGNGGLILDLAAGPRGAALQGQSLFNEVNTLAGQLGTSVARNDFGPEIDRVVNKLDRINDRLKTLPKDFALELNNVAANSRRDRRSAA